MADTYTCTHQSYTVCVSLNGERPPVDRIPPKPRRDHLWPLLRTNECRGGDHRASTRGVVLEWYVYVYSYPLVLKYCTARTCTPPAAAIKIMQDPTAVCCLACARRFIRSRLFSQFVSPSPTRGRSVRSLSFFDMRSLQFQRVLPPWPLRPHDLWPRLRWVGLLLEQMLHDGVELVVHACPPLLLPLQHALQVDKVHPLLRLWWRRTSHLLCGSLTGLFGKQRRVGVGVWRRV
jgi:hypothetical protein